MRTVTTGHLNGHRGVQKVEGKDALRVMNPELAKPLERALEAMQVNNLSLALHYFSICAGIDPLNKAVLYFGSDAAQKAYFSLKLADPPAPPEKVAEWQHAARTLVLAASEADPSDPIARHNAGRFLHDDGDDASAIPWYRAALMIKREQVETWGNLGTCLATIGQTEEAEQCWSKCVTFEADSPSGTLAQAYVWLRRGDYLRGWKALNARWSDAAFQSNYGRKDLGGTMWTGQPWKKGDTLFLHGEQGLGDHVQFARYIPELLSRKIKVIGLETRGPLIRWFEEALGETPVVVYERDKSTLPGFTHHAPLMSLPGLLGMEELPAPLAPTVPRGTIASVSGQRRVGLCWKGATGNPIDQQRSIPDHLLAKLADIPGVTWVPLVYDPSGKADLTARSWMGKNVEGSPAYSDVYGLAQVLVGLDHVVSVDTMQAHVAGSLGIPTTILHRFSPEWRWRQEGDWADWYPTAEHLRCQAPGDWSGLLERVRQCLT